MTKELLPDDWIGDKVKKLVGELKLFHEFRSCHSEPIRQTQGKLREESLANARLKQVQRSFVVEFIPMKIGTPQDDRKCETRVLFTKF